MIRVHWQLGVGPTHAICGLDNSGKEPHRCLTDCDPCEGDRDKVNCPTCITLGESMLENLKHFHREHGPNAPRTEKGLPLSPAQEALLQREGQYGRES